MRIFPRGTEQHGSAVATAIRFFTLNILLIFKLDYTQKIDEGSTRAAFVVGANDPRLMDRNKNVFQLQNKKNESYIKFELDISPLENSARRMRNSMFTELAIHRLIVPICLLPASMYSHL